MAELLDQVEVVSEEVLFPSHLLTLIVMATVILLLGKLPVGAGRSEWLPIRLPIIFFIHSVLW